MNEMQQELSNVSRESEEKVLGAVFINNKVVGDLQLRPEHFYFTNNQIIYKHILKLYRLGSNIDQITILESLAEEKEVEDAGGFKYIAHIDDSKYTTSVSKAQEIIVKHYIKREQNKLIIESQGLLNDMSAVEFKDYITKQLQKIEEENDISDEDDGHISKVMARVAADSETGEGNVKTAKTGFAAVDKMTGGFKRKKLVVIGARPSVGKSVAAFNISQNYALQSLQGNGEGGPACVISIEMPEEDVAKRMIATEGNINNEVLRNPKERFTSNDWNKMYTSIGRLSEAPLHLFDKSNVDINYIRKKARMMERLYPGQHFLITIDYLQLIKGDKAYKGNKNLEMGAISEDLKAIAKEFDCTVIVLSQLSRENEKRQDKRPMNSDLRDSGGIEAAADIIILLHRDDYYDSEAETKGMIEWIIGKNRDGAIGSVMLGFKKEFSKFINIDWSR